jgi:hypothetical protein
MTDTFRALCAELTYCWSRTTNPDVFAENAAPIIGRMRAALSQSEPEGPPLEPRGCPTPGACSCPTSPTVPTELRGQEGSNG